MLVLLPLALVTFGLRCSTPAPADAAAPTPSPSAARPPPPPTAAALWRRFSKAGEPAREARVACRLGSADALEQVSAGAMSLVTVSGFGRQRSALALLVNAGNEQPTGYVVVADWTLEWWRRYLCARFDGARVRSLRPVGSNALLLTRDPSPDSHLRAVGERLSILSVGDGGGLRERFLCSRTQTCSRRELLGAPYGSGVLHVVAGCSLRSSPGLIIAERTIASGKRSTCEATGRPGAPSEVIRRLSIAHVGRGEVEVLEFRQAAHFVVLASMRWRAEDEARLLTHRLARRAARVTSSAWTFATTDVSGRSLPGFEPGRMVATLPPFASRRAAELARADALRAGLSASAVVTVRPADRADSSPE